MLYSLSKIAWLFAEPSRVLLLAAVAGWALGRRGRALAGVALGLIVVATVLPLGGLALAQLEATFPPLAPAAHVDGILLLGGALDSRVFDSRPSSGFNERFGRIYEAARLAKAYPQARVLAVGGSSPGRPEADALADVLVALGVARERIEIERKSRNTHENALFAYAIAQPKPGETWALVTSAFHMPRAMGCFRKVGFAPLADPVDYHWLGENAPGFDVTGGLEALDLAIHEYFGLASYWELGRTSALWPAP